MSVAPPVELQQKLPHDIRLWITNYLRHPNDARRNYDFWDNNKEEYLHYIADEDGPLVPSNWGDIVVLLFGRGCLKTFTCRSISAWACDMFPSLEVSVTAPRQDQTGEVVSQFKKAVEDSGMDRRYSRDKMTHQQFENVVTDPNTGGEYTSYSELKARSAWGEGDGLRGLHSHIGVIDEFQDVDEGTFSVFLEAIDQQVPGFPYFPTIFVIGTPKMAGSFFNTIWGMSDQKTWDQEAKEWRAQSEATLYAPDGAEEGQGYNVTGWHIDQVSCPLHPPEKIAFKKETYSKRKFKNEVLAEFYSPENDLLTEQDVRAVFDSERSFQRGKTNTECQTFMGVDWGGGVGEGAAKTVITVFEEKPTGETDVLKVDVLDSSMNKQAEIERVEEYIMQYDVETCVVDEGYGAKQREDLQDGNGTANPNGYNNVFGCHYGNVQKKDGVTWARKNTSEKRFFTVARTHMIENFVDDFKAGYITIPSADLGFGSYDTGTVILDQLSAPYTDRVETPDGTKKLKVLSDRNDDTFHSFVYAWIAQHHTGSQRTLKKIGSHSRAGFN